MSSGLDTGKEINEMLTQSFNIGASDSWSQSIVYTTTETFSKMLNGKTCGYWTFIPYLMTSCGSLTTAPTGYTPPGPTAQKADTKILPTDSNGHAEGKVLFVFTDYKTNGVLKTGQDPAYEYLGVSTGPK
ncbi:hypothetical protein BPAE_0063g00370 [Botrytis paeoniae]|uniref:Uncharacterized protein n=1 Tax=Botrytis paeoniae TaxID=278948 RepID=A0A4Z1FRN3_9HELO|nr:hypothetical protein BPAE_0063g00370 [Botrytis paeoniae]